MRIAILGTRGIPACYGGFETCAEELSTRLVQRGHNVAVYCRRAYYQSPKLSHRGVRLVHLLCLKRKGLETLSHVFLSILHALRRADVLLIFNVASSPICILARIIGVPVALNVDGLEWKRRKWGRLARLYYLWAAYLAKIGADVLITDSREMQRIYSEKFNAPSVYIPYGAEIGESRRPELLKRYGLEPVSYILTVTRLEPENNTDLIVKACTELDIGMKLVVVGGVRHQSLYSNRLFANESSKVCFLGPIYDKEILRELWTNCYLYFHGNEAGGTNPALLQAMAYGNCVIAIDVTFNKEVLGGTGFLAPKDVEVLKGQICLLIDRPEIVREFGEKAKQRVKTAYDWEHVCDEYAEICGDLTRKGRRDRARSRGKIEDGSA